MNQQVCLCHNNWRWRYAISQGIYNVETTVYSSLQLVLFSYYYKAFLFSFCRKEVLIKHFSSGTVLSDIFSAFYKYISMSNLCFIYIIHTTIVGWWEWPFLFLYIATAANIANCEYLLLKQVRPQVFNFSYAVKFLRNRSNNDFQEKLFWLNKQVYIYHN